MYQQRYARVNSQGVFKMRVTFSAHDDSGQLAEVGLLVEVINLRILARWKWSN